VINNTGILNINIKNLVHNYNFFKNQKTKLIVAPTIKANAYGLGAKKIFSLLVKNGCKHFFVATLDEGIKLNNKNNSIKIFILNGIQDYKLNKFSRTKLIPVINTIQEYEIIKKANIDYALHIDTGINRLGIAHEDIHKLDFKNYNLKLVMSHLSSSDEYKNKYNLKQKKIFNKFVKNKHKGLLFSLANSHGSILDKTYLYDMVRPGIGIYGGYENKKLEKKIKNVINFKGKIIQIKNIQKNQYIGYNRTYKTKRKIKIAIIGLGYEDGIPRSLSNKGFVYYKKYRFRILGRISMDTFTINISDYSHNLKVGDYVDIINDENKIDKFAKKCKTLSYEVLTSIGNRVYRNYE